MTSSSLSAILQLQGLPPLPRSLTGYGPPHPLTTTGQGPYSNQHQSHLHQPQPLHPQSHGGRNELLASLAIKSGHHLGHGRPSPPVPPPRPQSRRSSSSGSSFRASPDHLTNRSSGLMWSGSGGEMLRSSPRSLSSSPHSPHVDSGLGRSSADSSSERAFVRVIKSPPIVSSRLDAQLSQLKEDMNHLRQQDMALLGHLLQIHQGIQDLRQVLLPPPVPAPSGVLPMFQSTPSPYQSTPSRHPPKGHNSKGHPSQSQSSRLSILSSGASSAVRFFRRSSSDKLMAEAMGLGSGDPSGSLGMRTSGHGQNPRRKDDESDSLSSMEFGDV